MSSNAGYVYYTADYHYYLWAETTEIVIVPLFSDGCEDDYPLEEKIKVKEDISLNGFIVSCNKWEAENK